MADKLEPGCGEGRRGAAYVETVGESKEDS